jgi:hypothetical protein
MPILSMFYGIVIRMYFLDDKQHHAPHIHAESQTNGLFSVSVKAGYWLVNCLLERPD